MDIPKGYLERFAGTATKAELTEYGDYVSRAAKAVGQPYIVLHKRIEKAFEGKSLDYVMSYLRPWLHEAEKSGKTGLVFNSRFKQYREKLLNQPH